MVTKITLGNDSNFLYRFLVSPQLRWARYLILIIVLGIISFNQVFIIYLDYRDKMGGWIYGLTFIYLLTYMIIVCFNLFWLFPKYLLKRRYVTYLSLLSAAMLVALSIQMVIEYNIFVHWLEIYTNGIYYKTSTVIDYLSSFILSTLCMIGGTMTVLLKEWMIEHQRVSQLEKAHILSEVEQLKEQVSPELLFNTLHYSGILTLTEPEKTSKILMQLSQLLRYQLYDCSRGKVLLSGELTFLTNYLQLKQIYLSRFDYELTSEGEVNRVLVSPLLFIPFVQYAVEQITQQQATNSVALKIHLKVERDTIIFTCFCPGVNLSADKGLNRIRQRLNLLYDARHELLLKAEGIRLELKGGVL
ncbi:sensor histidine kinase [Bacteroides sp.]|uniref:sensor histidine kinase n=1 Tax=Bacteroides sp. TaxID=29523 RepID=UPI002619B68D|nr:histidine kinase [Bacteroides sp.]MDD3037845.1 histidine kinase [Bacteroides sp.]